MACGGFGQGGAEVRTSLGGDTILQTQGSMRHLLADGCVCQSPRFCSLQHAPWGRGSGAEAAEQSEHAEALAALADGQLQHPVHLFIRVIRREAQLVKACVCGG